MAEADDSVPATSPQSSDCLADRYFGSNSECGLLTLISQNPESSTGFSSTKVVIDPDNLGLAMAENPDGCLPTRDCPSPDPSTELSLGLNTNPELENLPASYQAEKSDGFIPTRDNPSHDPVTELNCSQQLPERGPGPVPVPSDDTVPKVGMTFQTEVAAYEFYKKYAKNNGFKVRKGKVQWSREKVIKRYFLCSKEGTRAEKQTQKATKCRRKETRTGCKAMMIILKVTDIEWKIIGLNLDHHHEHVSPSQSPPKKGSCRNISGAHPIIGTVNEAGMAKEAADAQNVGFRRMDCNNDLPDKKILDRGVVQSFIDYLRPFQMKDPSFFYTVGVDAENRIANFFWRDGRSKIDYDYFGDVLILDTTFRMDIYDMICAPFVGVNHHRQYVLLGCAFLLDETTESFIWLFDSFLVAMGGRQPKTIFTDECPALANAIGKVLPKTQHRLCMWHICQNAKKHLSENYSQPNFDSLFDKCIFDCQSKEEFHSRWDSLLEQYNLRENPWLQSLFNSREKWSHIFFSKKTFCARIESIRSGEGMNDVFHNLTSETVSLTKFAQQYEKEAERRREEELNEDFCNSKSLINGSSSQIEKQAAKIYTRAAFKLFRKELPVSRALEIEEIVSDGTVATFKITEDHRKEIIVTFISSNGTTLCECKNFESTGILCVHALKVLNAMNIFEIPDQYVLKRWKKYAKDVVDDCGEEMIDERKRPPSLDKSKLVDKALNLIVKCGEVKDTWPIADKFLKKALKEVEEHFKTKSGEDFEVNNEDAAARDTSGFGGSETQKTVNSPCVDRKEVSKSIKRTSCDEASTHHQPPIKVARGGIDRGSSGGLSHSNCVGRNSPKHANVSPRTHTPSTSTTFNNLDPIMQLPATSNEPISCHPS